MDKKKVKKLEEYKKEKGQMALFGFLELEKTEKEKQIYSNTVELYDFIPKYVWTRRIKRINGQFLLPLKREFEHRGVRYKVIITPARIEDRNGVVKDRFPGEREELVEDALRKLACYGKGYFLDEEASVVFDIKDLREELADVGHTFSFDEIKEALYICAKTNIEVITENGEAVFISNLFETLLLQPWSEWSRKRKDPSSYVRFNSLVTGSIKRRTFRQLDYKTCMSYNHILARWLHKRMSHFYTQASALFPYHIMLSTIIRDSSVTAYKRMGDNFIQIRNALDEMKEKEVVRRYEDEKIYEGRKLVDVKFTIHPHPLFVQKIIIANDRIKHILNLPK